MSEFFWNFLFHWPCCKIKFALSLMVNVLDWRMVGGLEGGWPAYRIPLEEGPVVFQTEK